MNTTDLMQLATLHQEALKSYREGERDPAGIVSPAGMEMLAGMGISPVFIYDCVDDLSRYGEPATDVFLELGALRLLQFRSDLVTKPVVPESELPRKTDQHRGVAWLPRIIRKAQCFLEGSLSPDVMYGCAGDRAFLKEYGATLPDFLIVVRDSGGDHDNALAFLKSRLGR